MHQYKHNSAIKISEEIDNSDPNFQLQVQRLYQLTVYSRWLFVGLLWASVGTWSIWGLRKEINLWLQHFTWVAVNYGLSYNPLSTLGLSVCIAMTLSILIWQSRNILFGISPSEKKRLEMQVMRIRQQGKSHPLWKWVNDAKTD